MFQKIAWLNYSFWTAIDDAILKALKDYSAETLGESVSKAFTEYNTGLSRLTK